MACILEHARPCHPYEQKTVSTQQTGKQDLTCLSLILFLYFNFKNGLSRDFQQNTQRFRTIRYHVHMRVCLASATLPNMKTKWGKPSE